MCPGSVSAGRGQPLSTLQYIRDNWDTLGPEVRTHLAIVAVTIAVAGAVGLVMGVAAARSRWFATVSLAVTSVIITVPSFALFGLLTIWLGLGSAPVIAGLILYALLPITRNTMTGLRAVEPSIVEAARGMGMSPLQVLRRVELPLALPVVLGGLRQATVMVVAIATVGAAVSSDNLGRPMLAAVGRTEGSTERVLSAVLLVAAIGVVADLTLALMQRVLSRGRVAAGPVT